MIILNNASASASVFLDAGTYFLAWSAANWNGGSIAVVLTDEAGRNWNMASYFPNNMYTDATGLVALAAGTYTFEPEGGASGVTLTATRHPD